MLSSIRKRRLTATLALAATSLGLVTLTSSPAQAAAVCGGNVSIYGTLPDGRLTYTAISPNTGDRVTCMNALHVQRSRC